MTHLMPGTEQTRTFVSESTSASHFWPLWRVKIQRSDANQVDTAARPKQLNAEKIVVVALVTRS